MGPRKLLIDEGVPYCIRERLRQDGHTIILAQELGKGISDVDLVAYAAQEKAILITRDLGMAHRVVWRELPAAVVGWLHVDGMPRAKQPEVVAQDVMMLSGGAGMHYVPGGMAPRLSAELVSHFRNLRAGDAHAQP